jgi:hypothetical protein
MQETENSRLQIDIQCHLFKSFGKSKTAYLISKIYANEMMSTEPSRLVPMPWIVLFILWEAVGLVCDCVRHTTL